MRKSSLPIVLASSACAMFATVVVAPHADAAALNLAPGSYTVDTTALTLTGPSTNLHGKNVHGVAVFSFSSVHAPAGVSITATGTRPFELKATGSLVLGGVIVSAGANATDFTSTAVLGGAGGGAGGRGSANAGHGPGGGGHASNGSNGAGGGGFGGRGAAGGPNGGGTPGARGAMYGDLGTTLQGGSGGGGASTGSQVTGGGGGGAVALFGKNVTVQASGAIIVSGGDGASGGCGASGGGSGGAIVLHGTNVQLDGTIVATGGAGGAGGSCGDGGGGAGGRVSIQYKSFVQRSVLVSVMNGGASGTESTGGCCGHGNLSPQVAGDNGRLNVVQIDASKATIAGPASARSGRAVTLKTKLTDSGTGAAIAHQPVTLWQRPARGGHWKKVTTSTTTAKGSAKASVKPKSSTAYRWTFAGTFVHLKASSPTGVVTVH